MRELFERSFRGRRGWLKRCLLLPAYALFLAGMPGGGVLAQAAVPGDINGDGIVDVRDVVLVMRYILDLQELSPAQQAAGDVNRDGILNVRDVTLMMRYALGLTDTFQDSFKLGSETLLVQHRHLVCEKNVGLVTNQSGVDRRGRSTIDLLHGDPGVNLVALFAPEHGLDGQAAAGRYVSSYQHPLLDIPVYSLYGETRMPTPSMLQGLDVILFDIQDIGARSYTYISTLNYCMVAAQRAGLPVVVLDRPNPLGGVTVAGPVMEEKYISFVGVDILPMAHGMTVGELARFFNRKIGVELVVVPMEGYSRQMLYRDTGLPWVQTSPHIPHLEAVYGYLATGQGEGTGIFQADNFRWVGGRGLNSEQYAARLNNSGLAGVRFLPEQRGEAGGVRLVITDPARFNPARTGIHTLAHAFTLGDFQVPRSGDTIVMFDKLMGTGRMGQYFREGLEPAEIERRLEPEIEQFKEQRRPYLLPHYGPGG